MRTKLSAKVEQRSTTNVHETYKVKTFELAAKLAVMDGTDDGLYNGLPIEVSPIMHSSFILILTICCLFWFGFAWCLCL